MINLADKASKENHLKKDFNHLIMGQQFKIDNILNNMKKYFDHMV